MKVLSLQESTSIILVAVFDRKLHGRSLVRIVQYRYPPACMQSFIAVTVIPMTDAQTHQNNRHQHSTSHITIFCRTYAMRLLGLGVRLVAGYSFFSLLLSFAVIHRFERSMPSWTTDARLGHGTTDDHTAAPNRPPKTDITIPLSTRFFPTYGTKEFFEKCAWTAATRQLNANCTFLVRPKSRDKRGHFSLDTSDCSRSFSCPTNWLQSLL